MRQVYKEFNQLVKKCLEISYNSTVSLIHRVHTDFSPRGNDDDEYLPDLYPPAIFPAILHPLLRLPSITNTLSPNPCPAQPNRRLPTVSPREGDQ